MKRGSAAAFDSRFLHARPRVIPVWRLPLIMIVVGYLPCNLVLAMLARKAANQSKSAGSAHVTADSSGTVDRTRRMAAWAWVGISSCARLRSS